MLHNASFYLDITSDVCPMTFVRAKLKIETMKSGETLAIRLQGREPIKNVPNSIMELGHQILSLTPEDESQEFGPQILIIRKS